MSLRHMAMVWQLNTGPVAKLVFLAMADTANTDTGECLGDSELLARRCSVNERTVRDKQRDLARAGYVRIDRTKTETGRDGKNRYYITAGEMTDNEVVGAYGGPMPTETAWAQNKKLVWQHLVSNKRLDGAAWVLAMFVAGVAGPTGNVNLHHAAIKSWLAPFWDEKADRIAAFKVFCLAVVAEGFTAAKATAPIWKTILAKDGELARWEPGQGVSSRPGDVAL